MERVSRGLAVGRFNSLGVKKVDRSGALLASDSGDILLPNKYLPAGATPGDVLRVFIYRDRSGGLLATTRAPKARVGQVACLEVEKVIRTGAFLDWGLERNLFVPRREQPVPMKVGKRYMVKLCLDSSGRIFATGNVDRRQEEEEVRLSEGQEVDLQVCEFTDRGARVIVDDRYAALLPEVGLEGGEQVRGVVKRLRGDHGIDVALKKSRSRYRGTEESKKAILRVLLFTGGFLPLTDRSSPSQIAEVMSMSKSLFKRALGGLRREGAVEIGTDGIRLSDQKKKTGRG